MEDKYLIYRYLERNWGQLRLRPVIEVIGAIEEYRSGSKNEKIKCIMCRRISDASEYDRIIWTDHLCTYSEHRPEHCKKGV